MDLVSLLLELKPLMEDPEGNFSRITGLLERHQGLAEYEVARFYVSRHWSQAVSRRLNSQDPRERLEAVRLIPLLFPRLIAAGHLRRRVKDADTRVATAARAAVRKLGLADVSLPDTRIAPPRRPRPMALGGWNPTGWFYGLYPHSRGKVKQKPDLPTLPKLESRQDVARLVGVEESELEALMRPGSGPGSGYVEFEAPKRSGGVRRICAPREKLKSAQRALLEGLLAHLPTHDAVHGFVPGRSTVTNANAHVGANVVVRVDLEDFFPTVHYRRVKGLFEAYGYNDEVASTLAGLTTWRPRLSDGTVVWPGVLPQGAPTSPAIANLVCRRMDARLHALATKAGAAYTRYADDLSFSFAKPPEKLGRFFWWVNAILQQEGFTENAPKRRVMRQAGRQRVTGLTVNQRVAIPREERRRFKAILANCRKHGVESQARGRPDFPAYLEGYAAYVRMVHPELGARWQAEVKELLGR
ncbi:MULTISPECIES: reverse transcriptase family protein [unclassified Myxococcus]|uniref:reverse transcriptase family protein n=1 Tax=unclassified Myxococcus TaxID=2648731 RepID=UPI001CC03A64|nr:MULTISPECIES: reverse transcriptase family protein [unclassified Myxococcus]MBZ4397955.1 reverse transcriptase family protein [Myxococcus sp. AS-1-15]MBZ4407488.1 reverse transcriptase family protein [Myxococcus sp. XM-1-1-1]